MAHALVGRYLKLLDQPYNI